MSSPRVPGVKGLLASWSRYPGRGDLSEGGAKECSVRRTMAVLIAALLLTPLFSSVAERCFGAQPTGDRAGRQAVRARRALADRRHQRPAVGNGLPSQRRLRCSGRRAGVFPQPPAAHRRTRVLRTGPHDQRPDGPARLAGTRPRHSRSRVQPQQADPDRGAHQPVGHLRRRPVQGPQLVRRGLPTSRCGLSGRSDAHLVLVLPQRGQRSLRLLELDRHVGTGWRAGGLDLPGRLRGHRLRRAAAVLSH